MRPPSIVAAAAATVAFALVAVACGSGGSDAIGGDGGSSGSTSSSGSSGNDPSCPASLPKDRDACTLAGKSCHYGCGTDAECVNGKWSVSVSDQACPPEDGGVKANFVCGSATCTGNQYCLVPCCGGPAPVCEPLPDSGTCPAGTTPSNTCNNLPDGKGCMPGPCTPPPPKCIDELPAPGAAGCTPDSKDPRKLVCVCA